MPINAATTDSKYAPISTIRFTKHIVPVADTDVPTAYPVAVPAQAVVANPTAADASGASVLPTTVVEITAPGVADVAAVPDANGAVVNFAAANASLTAPVVAADSIAPVNVVPTAASIAAATAPYADGIVSTTAPVANADAAPVATVATAAIADVAPAAAAFVTAGTVVEFAAPAFPENAATLVAAGSSTTFDAVVIAAFDAAVADVATAAATIATTFVNKAKTNHNVFHLQFRLLLLVELLHCLVTFYKTQQPNLNNT